MISQILAILNLIGCGINLGLYAWGTQEPVSLAVGIFCGFVSIFIAIVERE